MSFLPGEGGGCCSAKIPAQSLSPPRTGWKRLADELSRHLWFLEGERLCALARQHTRLAEFGDPPLQPALSVLACSLENEADLHPLGRFLMRAHLLELLETRLRLADFWRQHSPALQAEPIGQPLFIMGMPRSGSTFLHELLAQDPANRAPRAWEVMFPVPAPDRPHQDQAARQRRAAACLWCFRRLAPGADSVYPLRAQTPHECVAIHSYTFLSEEFVSTCRIPAYETFLRARSLQPAYAWEKRFLQHLQAGSPPRRWVLKSPDHVLGLAELFSAFPDAWVIHTHREPVEVLASSVELTRILQGLYAWPADLPQVRARETRMLAEGIDHLLHFRDQHPELAGRFIDVKYAELVADPLAAVARIYRQLGVPLGEAAAGRMRALAAGRARYRRRGAGAKAAWLRTALAAEASRFERYCSRFDLPRPPVEFGGG